MKKKVDLFLDSGAFSAWSKDVEIDIDAYIQFVKDNEEYIDTYVNLDIIGDPIGTYKNQKYMESRGLNPLPVFHTNFEEHKWLKKYLEEDYDYIGLGGMAGGTVTKEKLVVKLDFLWSRYLTDKNGYPKVKVHGFGLTSLSLMLRYPWYSVDSTSWVMTSRFGSVYVPKIKRGEYIYNENSWKICVSNKSPSNKETGKHIITFSKEEQKIIKSYFKDKGYTLGQSRFFKKSKNYKLKENEKWFSKVDNDGMREVERIIEFGLSNDYRKRDELNIIYFLDLEKSMPKWPWPFKLKRAKGFGL